MKMLLAFICVRVSKTRIEARSMKLLAPSVDTLDEIVSTIHVASDAALERDAPRFAAVMRNLLGEPSPEADRIMSDMFGHLARGGIVSVDVEAVPVEVASVEGFAMRIERSPRDAMIERVRASGEAPPCVAHGRVSCPHCPATIGG